MKRMLKFVSVLTVCLLVLNGPSALWAAQNNIKDEDIADAVETEMLMDEHVASHLIDVSVQEGVVTLKGTVDTLFAEDHAIDIVHTVKGVRTVIDRMKVKDIQASDRTLRSDIIATLLEDPAAESYEVTVSVENGIATLKGTVDSWAERNLCEELAMQVKGIKGIENDITVTYSTRRSDTEIKKDIQEKFEYDPYIDDGLIDISVDNGTVSLSGSVGSSAEKQLAADAAWVTGVSSVKTDDLDVKWWLRDDMQRKSKYVDKPDEKLENAVKDGLLYDPRAFSFMIDVDVDNGAATLRGTVDNLRAKKAAGQVASDTLGIWSVDNRIKVRHTTPPSDTEIEENISEAISRNSVLNDEAIFVDVINQKAYLTGTVDSSFEKTLAENTVSGVYGVVSVTNNISVVKEWPWKSDTAIKADIESKLFWDVFIDSGDITVTVENGTATLEGEVDSVQEHTEAVKDAFEAGAKRVRTELEIDGNNNFPLNEEYPSLSSNTNP